MRRIVTGLAALTLVLAATVVAAGPVSSAPPTATWAWTSIGFPDEGCVLGQIDLTTGDLTQLPGTPSNDACVQDLAAGPDGSVWGIDQEMRQPAAVQGFSAPQADSGVSLVRFDTTTGEAASVTPIDIPDSDGFASLNYGGIAIGADGTVWVHIVDDTCGTGDYVCLFTVDPATGAATQIGPSDLYQTYMDGLAVCDGGPITLVGDGDGGPRALANGQDLNVGRVNVNTGVVTEGADTPDNIIGYDCGGATSGYALLGEEILLLDGAAPQATQASLTTFDPSTGGVSFVADIDPADADVSLLAIPPASTPPPPTTPTTAAPTTSTTAAAAQPAVVTPRFTG